MTTIVNNPPASDNSSGPMGIIIGLVVLVVIGYLVWAYGIPAMQRVQSDGVQINVPSELDVNVNQTTQ